MKKLVQFFALGTLFTLFSATVYAQDARTFYVCGGTTFTLTAGTGSGYDSYSWRDVSDGQTATEVATTAALSSSVTNAGTTTIQKKYSISVFKAGEGCYSDPVTYTVYVLPKPVVSLNTPGAQCQEVPTALTLTATVAELTLPSGVTADVFEWKKGATTVQGNDTNTLQLTSSVTETYSVTVKYKFGGVAETNGGTKVADCVSAAATTTITVNAKPSAPTVTFQ